MNVTNVATSVLAEAVVYVSVTNVETFRKVEVLHRADFHIRTNRTKVFRNKTV